MSATPAERRQRRQCAPKATLGVDIDHLIASDPLAEARKFAMAAGVFGKHTHVFACVEEGANGRGHCFTHNQVCVAVDRVDDGKPADRVNWICPLLASGLLRH